jgi:hypothetical protein
MPKRKIFVGHGKTAIKGSGTRRGNAPATKGSYWNPPSDPATVKDLNEIKKIEKELNEDSKKKKTRSDAKSPKRSGGGGGSAGGIPGQVGRWMIDRKTGRRTFKLM